MRIVVLGAGLEGTASAWYLRGDGHEVVVLERREAAAMEASFANGGQISVSHAVPWANPRAPLKVLKWLVRADAPLLFRLRADWRQWLWCAQFLVECLPSRTRRNSAAIAALGRYSRAALQALRRETGLRYDELARGILHFYTDAREFDAACATLTALQRLGLELSPKTPAECVAIEPALAACQDLLAGGIYAPDDESGDAHRFAQALASLAEARGVEFRYRTEVVRIEASGHNVNAIAVVRADGVRERVRGDAYVLALGSWSPLLCAPLGIRLPIYPAKGYSVTMPVKDPAAAWTVSLTDDEHKLVYSRLGERLRIAGMAELAGYDLGIDPVRCAAILRRVGRLFPLAGDASRAELWAGLRPSTPSNVPLIGRTRYANLYLNTGHGTLGWTHACGSARALADLVSGRRPEVPFPFTGCG